MATQRTMSLDIDLSGEPREEDCVCSECWQTHKRTTADTLYSANYTHNGRGMADASGIYQALWRAEENGIKKASQLIEPLRAGLAAMVADPAKFKQYDSPNGWGKYEHFVPWVRKLLAACEEHPDANVRTSR